MGIARGVTRNLAFYNGKKDYKILPDIISSSVLITAIASLVIAILLFAFSGIIAKNIFQNPSFQIPLMVFSIAIPIKNIFSMFISISKGFKNIKPMVYFQQISQNVLFFLFLLMALISNQSFIYIFYLFLLSLSISCVLLIIYTTKKVINFKILDNKRINFSQAKPLLIFSLPLLFVELLNSSTNWINKLMIAGIKDFNTLGLYASAGTITAFIGFPISLLLALYTPVISNLYGLKKIFEIKRIYMILTKWLCFFTFPMFIFLFIFSKQIIILVFGNGFAGAEITFKILAISTIIANFSGLNGATLVSIGKTRLVLYSLACATIMNIILNIFLIPKYGIEGAAISVSVAVISFNIIKSSIVYKKINAIPISYNLIKPTILLIMITPLFYFFKDYYSFVNKWYIFIFLLILYLLYFVFFLITKSIDQEDIDIIDIIGKKIHLNIRFLTKFLRKFKN